MKKDYFIKGMALVFGFVLVLILCSIIESTYKREVRVNAIEENVVTFEDECGFLWDWEKEESEKAYSIGEKATLIMFNNHTENNIYDDEIKRVKRS